MKHLVNIILLLVSITIFAQSSVPSTNTDISFQYDTLYTATGWLELYLPSGMASDYICVGRYGEHIAFNLCDSVENDIKEQTTIFGGVVSIFRAKCDYVELSPATNVKFDSIYEINGMSIRTGSDETKIFASIQCESSLFSIGFFTSERYVGYLTKLIDSIRFTPYRPDEVCNHRMRDSLNSARYKDKGTKIRYGDRDMYE